jgi:hypothetical protein
MLAASPEQVPRGSTWWFGFPTRAAAAAAVALIATNAAQRRPKIPDHSDAAASAFEMARAVIVASFTQSGSYLLHQWVRPRSPMTLRSRQPCTSNRIPMSQPRSSKPLASNRIPARHNDFETREEVGATHIVDQLSANELAGMRSQPHPRYQDNARKRASAQYLVLR